MKKYKVVKKRPWWPEVWTIWKIIPESSKNVVGKKEHAEAILALCQLLQLRDKTRENCENWSSNCVEEKNYTIYLHKKAIPWYSTWGNEILSFSTAEVRDEFLAKHKELIEKVLHLYT